MRSLIPLLFLPTLALAQAPEQQGPPFEQIKENMLKVFQHSLPAMKQTKDCVSKAGSTADVEGCMKAMADSAKAIQEQMGMPGGPPPDAPDMTKAPADFVWNDETKAQMLQQIDFSIQQGESMQECLQSGTTAEEVSSCMQSKRPKQ